MTPMLFAADALLIIKIIGGILFVSIYVFNQIMAAAAKQQRRQARPEVRPDGRPARPGGRPDVQDEVAEFLKRAAEKRPGGKAAEGRPGQERGDPRILEMRAAAQKRQAGNRPAVPAMAEIVEAREVRPLEGRSVGTLPSVGRPVPMQVDTRELAQRAGHLTHVDQTEAAFEAHMQSLDHQVGRINEAPGTSPVPPDSGPQTAAAPLNQVLAGLLADPQSLRQAIILNEILERPIERW
jgi:hypothetical protein